MVDTGTIPALQKLRDRIPPGLAAITRLPGVGPKRVRAMYDQLGIDSLESLRAAAESGHAARREGLRREVRGERARGARGRRRRASRRSASSLLARRSRSASRSSTALRAHPAAVRVEIAGLGAPAGRLGEGPRHRRRGDRPGRPRRGAGRHRRDRDRGLRGRERRARPRAQRPGHRPAGRRARPVRQPAPALHGLGARTTSRCARRRCAAACTSPSTGSSTTRPARRPRCATEEEVYERLGLPWIEPELREDRGELAPGFEPPRLVTVEDLRGDLHCHTTLVGRAQHARGDGARARRRAATSTSRSPTTRRRTASATT